MKNFLKILFLDLFFFIFNSVKSKSGVREGKRPVSGQSKLWKSAGLPDRTWCPVKPYPNQTKGADYAPHTTTSPPDSKNYLHLCDDTAKTSLD